VQANDGTTLFATGVRVQTSRNRNLAKSSLFQWVEILLAPGLLFRSSASRVNDDGG